MLRFGLRVLEERETLRMTQEELAERIGMSPRQVQRIESGIANVALDKIIELSNVLGTDPAALFRPPMTETSRRPGRPPKKP